MHRTAIHFLGKYNGSLKTNIPNVGCLVIVRMDLLNKYPRGPITFHPRIDNMSTWPQKCLLSTSSNSYWQYLCDGGGSVVVGGGAVGVGPGPLLLLTVLVTVAEHRSSVPVNSSQPGNVGCCRLSEYTVVRNCDIMLLECPPVMLLHYRLQSSPLR